MKPISSLLSTFSFISASIASVLIFDTSPVLAQSDGCGSGSTVSILSIFSPVGSRQFRVACNEHDDCYDTFGKSKQECDKAFHKRMLGTCARDHNTILGRPLKIACNGRADAYYTGVMELAQGAYDRAQTAARERAENSSQPARLQEGIDLYRTILGREPEPGAAEGVANRLANGSTLAQERENIANSEESRVNLANLYITILGREPEPGAVDGLVSRLSNGSTLAQERENIANSEEATNGQ